MASSGLPSGAFVTTIDGRRCTAIPRAAAGLSAASESTSSVATRVATTTSSLLRTTTSSTTTTSEISANATTGLAAAPAAEIEAGNTAADQSSASTTSSSSLVITTTSSTTSTTSSTSTTPPSPPRPPPGPVRVAQAQDSAAGTPTRPPTPPPPAVTLQSFTAFADSSQADGGVTAPATSSPALAEGPAATPLLTTIGSPQRPTGAVGDTTSTNSVDPALNVSTVAVAGGVIGGVVAISILTFFIWWWRRRVLRKRRSTLLTPLDAVPSFDRDEKGGYVITRGSIGPTPVTEKVRAALGQNFRRIRGHIRNRTAPSVNLDRGTSQFIDMASTHSRSSSGIIDAERGAGDRVKGWWTGVGKKFGRRTKSAQETAGPAVTQESKPRLSSQPDFLTLVNMDDRELDREAQRLRKGSASSTDNFLGGLSLNFGSDDPFSDANAIAHTSAKPAPLALGGGGSTSNPFSDANAIRDQGPSIPKPATYVADIRRSRSNSTAGQGGAAARRQPSTVYNYAGRDSVTSLGSMATATTANQRNKFRSDPFDLERPELLGGGTAAKLPTLINPLPSLAAARTTTTSTANPNNNNSRPGGRARAESFTSRYSKYSKYSSGVSVVSAMSVVESMGEWSDPGPDVGPGSAGAAAAAATAASSSNSGGNSGRWVPDGNGVGATGWRERLAREREAAAAAAATGAGERRSGGSLGSVGKAM
ncbi:hypothetical protein C8A05DRAFT_46330 [Staphylotrichum tortipilum]|uniref:Uncharacterized protein n=1 Tax=Staphylotrichum tortipilum TaxID=2831512 RepID=A0AAN6MGF2_9PEZI|nr:hypothetical protein C8A05DRAFT_46330 [Staphylotrichum longicolle]